MMLSEDQLIESMWHNRLMETDEAVAVFEEAAAVLASDPNDEMLPKLYKVFDDRCEHDEVMWGLLHFVEDFPLELYVQSLVAAVPEMYEQAPEWTQRLLIRVLNSDEARRSLAAVLQKRPASDTNAVYRILETIAEDTKFKAKVASVLP